MKHSKVPACDFTAMDMTSTILNAMGVEFTSEFQGEKNHIGLSIDTGLFSEEENLVCRVYRFSSFYNGLHINPNS